MFQCKYIGKYLHRRRPTYYYYCMCLWAGGRAGGGEAEFAVVRGGPVNAARRRLIRSRRRRASCRRSLTSIDARHATRAARAGAGLNQALPTPPSSLHKRPRGGL